jgi:septal ring factor EnvC (AmiA/AmiB activator)
MPDEQMNNLSVVINQIANLRTELAGFGKDLAINTTETKNIVARLDKLNGTVAEHQKEIISLDHDRIQILSHISRLLEKQNDMEAEQKAAKKEAVTTDRRKSDVYKKILLYLIKVIGAIIALLLYNVLVETGIISKLTQLPF